MGVIKPPPRQKANAIHISEISLVKQIRVIKRITKHTTLSEQFQNQIEKTVEKDKIDTSNTQIHDRSLSWLGTGTSVKSGGVKLVLWYKTQKRISNHRRKKPCILFGSKKLITCTIQI